MCSSIWFLPWCIYRSKVPTADSVFQSKFLRLQSFHAGYFLHRVKVSICCWTPFFNYYSFFPGRFALCPVTLVLRLWCLLCRRIRSFVLQSAPPGTPSVCPAVLPYKRLSSLPASILGLRASSCFGPEPFLSVLPPCSIPCYRWYRSRASFLYRSSASLEH
jgi:hypothetical protein